MSYYVAVISEHHSSVMSNSLGKIPRGLDFLFVETRANEQKMNTKWRKSKHCHEVGEDAEDTGIVRFLF